MLAEFLGGLRMADVWAYGAEEDFEICYHASGTIRISLNMMEQCPIGRCLKFQRVVSLHIR